MVAAQGLCSLASALEGWKASTGPVWPFPAACSAITLLVLARLAAACMLLKLLLAVHRRAHGVPLLRSR